MKYVVFYGGPMAAGHNASAGTPSNDETMAMAQQHYPAHRARVDQFIADKRILIARAPGLFLTVRYGETSDRLRGRWHSA